MEVYKPRKVEFYQVVKCADWNVKVYTITHHTLFTAQIVLDNAIANLPEWLAQSKTLTFPTYNTAFLIVHEGKDGVWSLMNWWTGGEILHSTTYFTSYKKPANFTRTPLVGFMACVWEMAVISFERAMWIEYILKKANQPDFAGYLHAYLSKEV